MKKTFLLLALLGPATLAQAQTPVPAKMAHLETRHMMLHDGKMMMEQDGTMTPMTENMTLANGTQVMTDGTVMMKNGQKMKLKENEMIGMDGKLHDGSKLHSHMKHNAKGGAMKKM